MEITNSTQSGGGGFSFNNNRDMSFRFHVSGPVSATSMHPRLINYDFG